MKTLMSARACVLVLASVSLALPMVGCVSQGRYNEVVEENEQLRQDRTELTRTAVALAGEVILLDAEVAVLEQEHQDLADEMVRWKVKGAIQMVLLTDGIHIILPNDVLFSSGSVRLKADGKTIIKELVAELGDVPYQIAVLGHTDNVPVGARIAERFPSNWELAGARAATVVRELAADGIPPQQLVALSVADTRPLAPNDTPEGRAQNRRIEVRMRPVIR